MHQPADLTLKSLLELIDIDLLVKLCDIATTLYLFKRAGYIFTPLEIIQATAMQDSQM